MSVTRNFRAFRALCRKEFLIELRTFETVWLISGLALLFSVITGLGVREAFLDPAATERLFPALFWIVFLCSSSITLGRSYEHDLRLEAIHMVTLSGTEATVLYLSKMVMSMVISLIGLVVATASLAILLDLPLSLFSPLFALVAGGVLFGYSALTTLLSGVVLHSRLRALLLPLILLPLLFPLFFCGLELGIALTQGEPVHLYDRWPTLLIVLDVVYFVLGITLFDQTLRE